MHRGLFSLWRSRLCFVAFLFAWALAPTVFAAESTIVVSQVVATTDSTPPSVPVGLVAQGISPSSVLLGWSPSSDDVAVAGYAIFRNGIALATTTSPTFSDTGLPAETTNTYTIIAFDAAGNRSLPSASVAGTTLAVPVIPIATGGVLTGNAILSSFISERPTITVSGTTAIARWATSFPIQTVVSWGRGSDLEAGSVGETTPATSHQTMMDDLVPGALYHVRFALVAIGVPYTVYEDTFFVPFPATTDLQKKSPLVVEKKGDVIALSWVIPPASSAVVRVVRSDIAPPKDSTDGAIVYEGKGRGVDDASTPTDHVYYYTLFVQEADGTWTRGNTVATQGFDHTPPSSGGPSSGSFWGRLWAPFRSPEASSSPSTVGASPIFAGDVCWGKDHARPLFPEGAFGAARTRLSVGILFGILSLYFLIVFPILGRHKEDKK